MAVFSGPYRFEWSPQDLDAMLLENPQAIQLEAAVERRLPAEGEQYSIGFLTLDDSLDKV